jgi:hypothetical protein
MQRRRLNAGRGISFPLEFVAASMRWGFDSLGGTRLSKKDMQNK